MRSISLTFLVLLLLTDVLDVMSSSENKRKEYAYFDIDHTTAVTQTFETDKELALLHDNLNQGTRVLERGSYFDTSASRNVTALVGKTASLNCRIKNLGNKTVSWIRHRDLHLLTVVENTYTSDQRFTSSHNKQTGDWSLQLKYAQIRDSGVYECQVSTTPPVGYTMVLSIVEPITSIHGGPDLYIDTGSTVNLTCIVKHLPEPPPLVRWTHNNEEINYDSARGGVSVITEKGDITTSYLLIQKARISDSGVYTCSPSSANPKSVNVHVLYGEQPAAIQRGTRILLRNRILIFISLFLGSKFN
ncbi:zwei Ig domain protein zig-8-like [Episyrphus balteatus]|uniref:zwei Ig domain protein zig-8-like n=1 Tax=Episyrphus balteatus TaxID=286459 RepID=UPI0024862121|nr:zwei Ig domain protein zig-8-like [Episyrphus balteatus]XP_055838923.1 zwei Ig domain protein zig-8-like [Episyrphus balteatus]XP_055838924.1 zwei Ig domain protein zig-8-like [Episyrphus balteatus]